MQLKDNLQEAKQFSLASKRKKNWVSLLSYHISFLPHLQKQIKNLF